MKTINLVLIICLLMFAIVFVPSISLGAIAEGNVHNTADGNMAFHNNMTGSNNSALGDSALYSNTTGNDNTASGYQALFSSRSEERRVGKECRSWWSERK